MQAYDYLVWTPTEDLYHHGIKGQKWGQKNGPPYPLDSSDHSAAEKKAYGLSGSEASSSKISFKDRVLKKSSSKSSSDDKKEQTDAQTSKKTSTKKSVKDMTDEELSSAIRRAEMEKRYAELTTPEAKKTSSFGEKLVKDVSNTVYNVGMQTFKKALTKKINDALGLNDDKKKSNGAEDLSKTVADAVKKAMSNNSSNNQSNTTSDGKAKNGSTQKSSTETRNNTGNKDTERYTGTVEGTGTSSKSYTSSKSSGSSNSDPIDVTWEYVYDSARNTSYKSIATSSSANNFISANSQLLLEDLHSGR